MTKKNREKFFERVRADAERFCPDLTSISKSEVSDLLAAAGTDAGSLRRRLNESAKKLALAQLQRGNKAPAYLQDVKDMTGPPMNQRQIRRSPLKKRWSGSMGSWQRLLQFRNRLRLSARTERPVISLRRMRHCWIS